MFKPLSLILLTFLLVFLSFFKLGDHPIHAWDEARVGVKAIEMLQNGDWINPHYAGEPDSWEVKPPAVLWCVAGSFSIFGFNELGLRMPSALAILFAFFVVFKIIVLYKDWRFAFSTCLILMSVKGMLGWHIGRTGDHDAMLMCLLLLGVYHFLQYFDFDKKKSIYWAGFFFGLAFLVKGPAMGVLFPGMVMYAIFSARWKVLLKAKEVWLGVFICLLFPVAWFSIIQNFGVTFEEVSTGENTFERLFIYDLWERFTQNESEWKKAFSPDFFFYSIDKLFNLWGYVFFGLLGLGCFHFIKNKNKTKQFLLASEQRLLLLSLCLYFPLAIFLTLAAKSHSWYLAPAIPFVGIVTFYAIDCLMKKYRFAKSVFIVLLVFTIGRQIYSFASPKEKSSIVHQSCELLSSADEVFIIGRLEQDILLYNYFCNRNIRFEKGFENLEKNDLIFKAKDNTTQLMNVSVEKLVEDENYSIWKRK